MKEPVVGLFTLTHVWNIEEKKKIRSDTSDLLTTNLGNKFSNKVKKK
jgi:hypothetical protein